MEANKMHLRKTLNRCDYHLLRVHDISGAETELADQFS